MIATQEPPAKTKLDGLLATEQRRHAADSERAELIARTRHFKASWIELAEALTSCQRKQAYLRWGYASFDEYYRKELHLKSATVNKLLGSYGFLRKSAPEVLARDGVEREFPPLKNIDFLRRAENAADQGEVAPDVLAELRDSILEEHMAPGKVAALFRTVLFPKKPEEETQRRRRDLSRQAASLLGDLQLLAEARNFDGVPQTAVRQLQVALESFLSATHNHTSDEAAA